MRVLFGVIALASLGGCALVDAATGDGSGSAGGGPIVGKATVRYISGDEAPFGDENLMGVTVGAVAIGHEQEPPIQGTGDAAGNIHIDGVPDGDYYLWRSANALQEFYYETTRNPQLQKVVLGRPNIGYPNGGSLLPVNVTGLAPWQTGDDLQVYAPNAGMLFLSPQLEVATEPAVGATTFSGQLDWKNLGLPMVDPGLGDVTYLAQLSQVTSGEATYKRIVSFGNPNVQILGAGDGNFQGNLSTVNADRTIDVVLQQQEYEMLVDGAGAGKQLQAGLFYLDVVPNGPALGLNVGAPDIIGWERPPTSGNASATLQYGDPYPPGWTRLVVTGVTYGCDRTADGASSPFSFPGNAFSIEPLSAVSGAVPPQMGPPTMVVMGPGNRPASDPLMQVTTTPRISWEPPTLGAPDHYVLHVYRIFVQNGGTRRRFIARFETRQNEVTIPAGVLTLGESYVFTLTPHLSPSTAPLPDAMATYISNVFKP